jgi:predicted metalloprotease with PDZ domain
MKSEACAAPDFPLPAHRIFLTVKLFSFIAFVLLSSNATHATINYSIAFDHPENHLFHVRMTIPDVHDSVTIQMPAWNATYQIRDFASRIQNLQATDKDTKPLAMRKIDKQTWIISGGPDVEIKYDIFWDEAGPFASQLNSTHAFMNLAEILIYLPDRRNEAVAVNLAWTTWRLATAMPFYVSARGANRLYGIMATNYDALVDGPAELGVIEEFELPGIEPKVSVAVHSENYNKRELEEGLTKIVRYETQLMGGAPYDHYQFIFHIDASGAGGGGMEHANSTAIGATSSASAISTAAHEFFHLWNVKRIRPQSLEPIDYTKEMYTRSLWFAEGVTSTYAAYAEVRTGLWSANQFYEDLAYQIQELQDRPARKWQSVEESSLNAWLEKYPQYNQPEYSISYYNKGQLVGFFLDVLIRDATDNHKSLDDVMRSLNENFAKKGRFYNDSTDIEATAESVAGVSFKDFFAKYVVGTEDWSPNILGKVGLESIVWDRRTDDLGFRISNTATDDPIIASSVQSGSAAEKAGLRVGDVLISFNGEDGRRGLIHWMEQPGSVNVLKLRVHRKNSETEVSIPAGQTAIRQASVMPAKGATEKQHRILEGILHGQTN